MSSDLSHPLVPALLLLGLAALILVLGLALQERANRRASRSRPFWQESAEVEGDRGHEGLAAAQATVKAPVTNGRLPEDHRRQELVAPVPAFDSQAPTTAAISAINELEALVNTWAGRIEPGVAPASAPAQEPVTNDQPKEPPPEREREMEELAGANGSDGGRARIAPARDAPAREVASEATARDVAGEATAQDVAGEDGVQDKDRRWMEELMARAKAAEESCGRTDEAAARIARLMGPPPSESAD